MRSLLTASRGRAEALYSARSGLASVSHRSRPGL